MKNTNLKFNKTKLVAKLMLVILLLTSTLTLASCGGPNLFGNYHREYEQTYYTHEEFNGFIEKYNSKNDGAVSTFISFDFMIDDAISYKSYHCANVLKFNKYFDKVYDKYQNGFGVRITLYLDDVDEGVSDAYQIYCSYSINKSDFYFNENNELTLSLFDDSEKKSRYIIEKDKIYVPDSCTYNYICTYNLTVDGVAFMQISIASLYEELEQENLDEICKLLMDNIVIINTEG